MRAAVVALALTIAASVAAAAPVKIMVLPLDGNADARTRAKFSQSVQRLARVLDGKIVQGTASFTESATVIGCDPSAASCADDVRATLGVDELVYGTLSADKGQLVLVVRRVSKGKPPHEVTATVGEHDPPERAEAALLPLFHGAGEPVPPVDKPKPTEKLKPTEKSGEPIADPKDPPNEAPRVRRSGSGGPEGSLPNEAPRARRSGSGGPEGSLSNDPATEPVPGTGGAASGETAVPDPRDPGDITTADQPRTRRNRTLGIAAAAGGGTLILIGFVLWSNASSLQTQIDQATPQDSGDFAQLTELEDRATTRAWTGNVLVFGGLALGAYGGWLLYKDYQAQSAVVTPAPMPGGGVGLTLTIPGGL